MSHMQFSTELGNDYLDDIPINKVVAGAAYSSFTTPWKELSNKFVDNEKNVRMTSKRQAAKQAAFLSQLHGNHLAELANTNKISDEQLLLMKPQKQRRTAKFENPVPSNYCHVCSRLQKNVRVAVCINITSGTCQKVICERCFKKHDLGNFENAIGTGAGDWKCSHCMKKCPERAQCKTYRRVNKKMRVNRLKTYKNNFRKRGKNSSEGRKDVTDVTDAEKKSTMNWRKRKLRRILPAIASSSKTMEIGNQIDDMQKTAVENMGERIDSPNLHEWSNPKASVAVHLPNVNQNEMNNTSIGTDIMDSAGVNNSVMNNYALYKAGMNNTYMESGVMDTSVMGSAGMNNAVFDNAAMENSSVDYAVDFNEAELGVMTYMPFMMMNNGSTEGNVMFGMDIMRDDCIPEDVSPMDAAEYEVLGAGVLGADTTEQFEIDEYERDVTNQLNNIIAKVQDENDEIGRW